MSSNFFKNRKGNSGGRNPGGPFGQKNGRVQGNGRWQGNMNRTSGASDASASGGGVAKFLLWSGVVVLLVIVLILVIFAISYWTSDCTDKKDFFDYLADMDLHSARSCLPHSSGGDIYICLS